MFSSQDPIANTRSAASHKASSQAPTPLANQSAQMGQNMANSGAMHSALGGLVPGLAGKSSSNKTEQSKPQSCNASSDKRSTSSSASTAQSSRASNNQSLDDLLDVNANASGGGWCGTDMAGDEQSCATGGQRLNESLTQFLGLLQQMLASGQYGSNLNSEQQALISQLIREIEQLLADDQTQQPSVETLANQLQMALDQGDMAAFSDILTQLQETLSQQQAQSGDNMGSDGGTGSVGTQGTGQADIERQQQLRNQQVSQTLEQMRRDTEAALAMLQSMVLDDPSTNNGDGDFQSVVNLGSNTGTGLGNNSMVLSTGQNVFNPSMLPSARPFNP